MTVRPPVVSKCTALANWLARVPLFLPTKRHCSTTVSCEIGSRAGCSATCSGCRVLAKAGTITLDASFNGGGDIIRLPGKAGDWSISRSGSSAKLTNSDLALIIPVGTVGTMISFEDGARNLIFEAGSFKIGGQSFTQISAKIIGQTTTNPDIQVLADATARLVLSANAEAMVGGKVIVTGTTEGRENLMITGGSVTLDASFNKGGDIIDLPGRLSAFSAVRSGSSAVIANGKDSITIPVGTFGADILFDDASLVLVFSSGNFQIGNQILGSTSAVLIG